jgi:hypothetical protein
VFRPFIPEWLLSYLSSATERAHCFVTIASISFYHSELTKRDSSSAVPDKFQLAALCFAYLTPKVAHTVSLHVTLLLINLAPKPEKGHGAPVRHVQVRVKDLSRWLGKTPRRVVNHVIVDLSVGVLILSASRVGRPLVTAG